MTEEEKKAIEDLKKILKYWQKIVDIEDDVEREIEMTCYSEEMPFEQLKIALNLIEKLQKENGELKENERYMKDVFGEQICTLKVDKERFKRYGIQKEEEIKELKSNSILKDKIREIINEELPDDEICKVCERYDVNGAVIKQKLIKVLEEE